MFNSLSYQTIPTTVACSLPKKNSLTEATPFRDNFFAPFEEHFDKFFNDFWNPKSLNSLKAASGFPKTNAYKQDGELVLHVAASGMTSDNVNVDVTPNGELVISGKMSEEYQAPSADNTTWLLKELRQSSFERRFVLPEDVVGDPVASMKDGILTLRWKIKDAEKHLPVTKRIPINSE